MLPAALCVSGFAWRVLPSVHFSLPSCPSAHPSGRASRGRIRAEGNGAIVRTWGGGEGRALQGTRPTSVCLEAWRVGAVTCSCDWADPCVCVLSILLALPRFCLTFILCLFRHPSPLFSLPPPRTAVLS